MGEYLMKKSILIIISMVISISILIGCVKKEGNTLVEIETLVNEFVNFMKYVPTGEIEFIEKYTLTDEKIENKDINEIWRLQRASKEDFIDKEISVYKINVGNHPLGMEASEAKLVSLYLMFSDGYIFGGYSEVDGKIATLDGLSEEKLELDIKSRPVITVKNNKDKDIAKAVFQGFIEANKTDWRFIEQNRELFERDGVRTEPMDTYSEYSVGDINITNKNNGFFVADISYDLKLTDIELNPWAAGNGVMAEDNWLREKCNFVDIMKVGENKYVILNIYTG